MSLWGDAHAASTNKPKFLPQDENSDYNRADCYATQAGWVMQAGHPSSGNSNTSATPEVLVASGGLAGATDTTGLRAPTVTSMRFVKGTTATTDLTAVDSTGAIGTTTVTVMPLPLVVAPGSAVLTAAGDQAFTVAATASGSNLIACSISESSLGDNTTIAAPTVAAANLVCTASAAAVPAAGAANETFTITIVDTNNGDRASAALTLAHPTLSPGY